MDCWPLPKSHTVFCGATVVLLTKDTFSFRHTESGAEIVVAGPPSVTGLVIVPIQPKSLIGVSVSLFVLAVA